METPTLDRRRLRQGVKALTDEQRPLFKKGTGVVLSREALSRWGRDRSPGLLNAALLAELHGVKIEYFLGKGRPRILNGVRVETRSA